MIAIEKSTGIARFAGSLRFAALGLTNGEWLDSQCTPDTVELLDLQSPAPWVPGAWRWTGLTWEIAPGGQDLLAAFSADAFMQAKKRLEDAVDRHVDAVAGLRGYGTRTDPPTPPAASCRSWAGSPGPWQLEAQAFVSWNVDVLSTCYAILDDVKFGRRAIPSEEALIAELPVMAWPA